MQIHIKKIYENSLNKYFFSEILSLKIIFCIYNRLKK